jgi:hypothetical protein
MTETTKKIREIVWRQSNTTRKLIEPARAAAAQMKDAGMIEGSRPLFEVLFELDAINQELDTAIKDAGPERGIEALLELLERGGRE